MSLDGLFATPALQGAQMALDAAALQQQAISSNIANVNTPGFKRLDVSSSFQQAYNDAMDAIADGKSPDALPQGSLETAAQQGPARPDGNTVQLEQEMLGLAQNSAKYEFANQVLVSNFHNIKVAITGQA